LHARAPGRIKEIVAIHLARPRERASLLRDGHYQDYVVGIERLMDAQTAELSGEDFS
jgi:hypothetical protein